MTLFPRITASRSAPLYGHAAHCPALVPYGAPDPLDLPCTCGYRQAADQRRANDQILKARAADRDRALNAHLDALPADQVRALACAHLEYLYDYGHWPFAEVDDQ